MSLMILSILIFSLFFQSLCSNFIALDTSLWNPLCYLSALILIYPFFKDQNKYYFTCILYGIVCDVLFSEYFFQNAFLFLILGYIVTFFYHNLAWNAIVLQILQLLLLIVYRLFDYGFLILFSEATFQFATFGKMILSSILFNAIYLALLFFLFRKKYKQKIE